MAQAKKTLRIAASLKMATPGLHEIIVDTKAQSKDIAQYFSIKREKGWRVVPKPVLNAAVVAELTEKFNTTSDMKSCVNCVLACIEEFSSNSDVSEEVVGPWTDFHYGISELFCKCLNFIHESKRKEDSNVSKVLARFCNLLAAIANMSVQLSTRLFLKCAKSLLSMIFETNITQELKSVIFYAVGTLCQYADQSSILNTFSSLAVHLKVIAHKIILKLPVEAQMSVYYILRSSLRNKEHAIEAASDWFGRWPTLKDTFVTCYLKSRNEGCGIFLEKLHEVKISGDKNMSSTGRTPASTLTQSSSKGVSHKHDAELFKKPAAFRSSMGREPSLAFDEPQSKTSKQQKLQLKGYQTPYYPDHRKSLSLRMKSSTESVEERVNSQLHQVDKAPSLENRGSKRAHINSIHFLQPKLKRYEEGEFERFDKSKYDDTHTRRTMNEVKCEKLKEETDEKNSKVEKWLTDSLSSGNLPGSSAADDDVLIIDEVKCSASGQSNPICQKSQTFMPPKKSKRVREDSPQISVSTVGFSSTLTKHTKSDEEPSYDVKCEDILGNRRSQKLYSNNETAYGIKTSDHNSKSMWGKKVRELDKEDSKNPKEINDVYELDSNFVSQKKPAVKKIPSMRRNTRKKAPTLPVNIRELDKENVPPNPYRCVQSPKIPDICLKSGQESKKKKETVNCTSAVKSPHTATCYSPVFDDSVELADVNHSKAHGTQEATMAVKIKEVKSRNMALSTTGQPTDSAPPVSDGGRGGQRLKCAPASNYSKLSNSSAAPSSIRAANGSLMSNSTGLGAQSLKLVTSPANAPLLGYSCATSSTIKVGGQPYKSPTSPVNASCSRDADSGLEVTSNDEGFAENKASKSSSKKSDLYNLAYFKLKLAQLTEQAVAAKSQLAANNTTLSTEITEIKGLASKIADSVSRCENVVSSNTKSLSDQAAALEGCSKAIAADGGPATYRDQRQALRDQFRARHREKIIKAIKRVIESKSAECSSDSE